MADDDVTEEQSDVKDNGDGVRVAYPSVAAMQAYDPAALLSDSPADDPQDWKTRFDETFGASLPPRSVSSAPRLGRSSLNCDERSRREVLSLLRIVCAFVRPSVGEVMLGIVGSVVGAQFSTWSDIRFPRFSLLFER